MLQWGSCFFLCLFFLLSTPRPYHFGQPFFPLLEKLEGKHYVDRSTSFSPVPQGFFFGPAPLSALVATTAPVRTSPVGPRGFNVFWLLLHLRTALCERVERSPPPPRRTISSPSPPPSRFFPCPFSFPGTYFLFAIRGVRTLLPPPPRPL